MSTPSSVPSDAPNDTRLEYALRDTVNKIYDSGDLEELTVKRVRATIERELDLAEGFFKQAEWKTRSKDIIEEEALKLNKADALSSTHASSPVIPKSSKDASRLSGTKERGIEKKRKAANDTKDEDVRSGGRLAKKQRKSRLVISDDEEEEEQTTSRPEHGAVNTEGAADELNSDDEGSKSETRVSESKSAHNRAVAAPEANDMSDSDLSDVLDETPAPKRKKKVPPKKSEPKTKKSNKSTTPKAVDAEAEEIKSLQGWLVKCGIRKVWGKELKPYETSKEKIKHLKHMLTEAGMTGRYSKEKAASIREARELAADLEAVQEGAKLWGKEKDADAAQRGGRKAARPTIPTFDFGDSDSGD